MKELKKSEIIDKVNSYKWYHKIKVIDDVYTPSSLTWDTERLWKFILDGLSNIDFKGKKVLDIGCRDGLFSFEMEKRGAEEIIGIDNNLSRGASEFLIPFFESKVKMYEMNLYDLTPGKFGGFDVVIFPGVLYHLRYPFWGLKKIIDCLSDKGFLFVESGMNVDRKLENHAFLYCGQVMGYNRSARTYFNKTALEVTLRSFECKLIDYKTLPLKRGRAWIASKLMRRSQIQRQWYIFQKDTSLGFVDEEVKNLWNSTHRRYNPKSSGCFQESVE